jgi:hypothetical protein
MAWKLYGVFMTSEMVRGERAEGRMGSREIKRDKERDKEREIKREIKR